jgi:hypothetical protein
MNKHAEPCTLPKISPEKHYCRVHARYEGKYSPEDIPSLRKCITCSYLTKPTEITNQCSSCFEKNPIRNCKWKNRDDNPCSRKALPGKICCKEHELFENVSLDECCKCSRCRLRYIMKDYTRCPKCYPPILVCPAKMIDGTSCIHSKLNGKTYCGRHSKYEGEFTPEDFESLPFCKGCRTLFKPDKTMNKLCKKCLNRSSFKNIRILTIEDSIISIETMDDDSREPMDDDSRETMDDDSRETMDDSSESLIDELTETFSSQLTLTETNERIIETSGNEKRIESCKKIGLIKKRRGHHIESLFISQFGKEDDSITYSNTADCILYEENPETIKLFNLLKSSIFSGRDIPMDSLKNVGVSIKSGKNLQFTLGVIPELTGQTEEVQLEILKSETLWKNYLAKSHSPKPADFLVYFDDKVWIFFWISDIIKFIIEKAKWRFLSSERIKGDFDDSSKKGFRQYLTYEYRTTHKSYFLGANGNRGFHWIQLLQANIPSLTIPWVSSSEDK